MHKANTSTTDMAYILHVPPTESTCLLTAQRKGKIKARATQKSLPVGKWRFMENNKSGGWSQKQKRIRQKEQQD